MSQQSDDEVMRQHNVLYAFTGGVKESTRCDQVKRKAIITFRDRDKEAEDQDLKNRIYSEEHQIPEVFINLNTGELIVNGVVLMPASETPIEIVYCEFIPE